MKARQIVGMAAALLVLSMSLALAQGGGRRGGGFNNGGLQLLRIPEVQKELKMTQEQIDKIAAKQQEVQQAMQELRQGGGGGQQLSAEERAKRNEQIQEIQKKAVSGILDATQMKRFHQLELQQQGPVALTRKDVASEMKLSEEQTTKIREIQTKMNEDLRAARPGGGGGQQLSAEERAQMQAKTQEIQKAANEKIVALLTDAQKTQWKEMTGEEFKFPPPMPRRRNNP